MMPKPNTADRNTSCPALFRASSCLRAPKNWLVITAPPVAKAANRFKMTLLIMSTRDTPDMAASPTAETITPSHMPTRAARACSITRGKINRTNARFEKSPSVWQRIPFTCNTFSPVV